MTIRTKFKIGDWVTCRFLGSPCEGVILEERNDGNYNVRLQNGRVLPNINWYDPDNKKKPWFIESFNGVTIDLPEQYTADDKASDNKIQQAFEEQKKYIRGKIKK